MVVSQLVVSERVNQVLALNLALDEYGTWFLILTCLLTVDTSLELDINKFIFLKFYAVFAITGQFAKRNTRKYSARSAGLFY